MDEDQSDIEEDEERKINGLCRTAVLYGLCRKRKINVEARGAERQGIAMAVIVILQNRHTQNGRHDGNERRIRDRLAK